MCESRRMGNNLNVKHMDRRCEISFTQRNHFVFFFSCLPESRYMVAIITLIIISARLASTIQTYWDFIIVIINPVT